MMQVSQTVKIVINPSTLASAVFPRRFTVTIVEASNLAEYEHIVIIIIT